MKSIRWLAGGISSRTTEAVCPRPATAGRGLARGVRFHCGAVPLSRRPSAADLSPLPRGEVQISSRRHARTIPTKVRMKTIRWLAGGISSRTTQAVCPRPATAGERVRERGSASIAAPCPFPAPFGRRPLPACAGRGARSQLTTRKDPRKSESSRSDGSSGGISSRTTAGCLPSPRDSQERRRRARPLPVRCRAPLQAGFRLV